MHQLWPQLWRELWPLSLMIAALTALAIASPGFTYERTLPDMPILTAVALMLSAGIFYLVFLYRMLHRPLWRRWLGPLLLTGLALRALFLFTTPVLEDDFYRYFYDGALLGAGLNPYQHPPADVFDKPGIPGAEALGIEAGGETADPVLRQFQDIEAVGRVAYPSLSTVYPPLAQAAFALSHWIAPFDLTVWRLILISGDLITLLLLIRLLDALVQPRLLAVVYWLNPVLIQQTVNAAHMDVLLLPLLVGAALLAVRDRTAWAGVLLAGAAGIKLWPVMLAPLVFRPYLTRPAILIRKALPMAVLTAVILLPQLLSLGGDSSGLAAYADIWRRNSFLFSLLEDGLYWLWNRDLLPVDNVSRSARLIAYGGLALILLWQLRRPLADGHMLVSNWLGLTAVLFFLSPTGYPWYMLWFLPWLAVRPNFPLLALSATLPLYQSRFWFDVMGLSPWFQDVVVPVEFGLVLLLLALPFTRRLYPEKPGAA